MEEMNKMDLKIRNRRGMTGLETAIILIAFVITAAAFSFVVLNMGFLSAQKTQTVISSGMQEASSSLLFDGDMIAAFDLTATPKVLDGLTFYLRLSQGKEPVDMDDGKMIITYSNSRAHGEIYSTTYPNGTLTTGIVKCTQVIGDGDTLVESGERWKVTIDFTATEFATAVGATGVCQAYDPFRLELRPATGSVLSIERNIGAINNAVQVLS
jgi:flagellin FlaB